MNSPAVLIGFSGCSLPLGEMPFLGGWSASGLRAGLTFPPAVSSVGAWTSLVTGLSPAQHGIFDFYRRQSPGSRQLRVLASRDLAPRIRVNAIGVGSTATSALDIVMSSDELRTAMEDATPLRRLGHVDDIASAILYLVSPAGAYVTGKIIEVDGGLQSPNLEFPLPDL